MTQHKSPVNPSCDADSQVWTLVPSLIKCVPLGTLLTSLYLSFLIYKTEAIISISTTSLGCIECYTIQVKDSVHSMRSMLNQCEVDAIITASGTSRNWCTTFYSLEGGEKHFRACPSSLSLLIQIHPLCSPLPPPQDFFSAKPWGLVYLACPLSVYTCTT